MTDKLRSYGVAHRALIPEAIHSSKQYENYRQNASGCQEISAAELLQRLASG